MSNPSEKPAPPGAVLLIGNYVAASERDEAASLLDELGELVATLGLRIAGRELVQHREMHARYLIGSGKAEAIAERGKAEKLAGLVFDHDLSPSQQRNWEQLAGMPVIDRQKVILDIFAARARTREARLQIELAQLEYSLPRLTRAWSHLGGQGGGIGGRGEGESQLEQDRRRSWKAMDKLKEELKDIRRARATQRKDRQRTPVPNCAIVGYTNSGKSSLLRRLTGAEVLVEDKLFATLDTTTRKVALPSNQPLLLTDTVGFVRKLPHRLVEAFKATLEEATQADFLIHLLDASAPKVIEFHQTTLDVLDELGAGERPVIVVFNKVDKVADPAVLHRLRVHFPDALFISVRTGEGIPALLEKMSELAAPGTVTRELRIPASESGLLARLHREGKVHGITYDGSDSIVTATLSARLAAECGRFVQAPQKPRVPVRGRSKAGNVFRDTGPEKSYGMRSSAKMRKAQSRA
ncbi:MAG: GTPase HflX [Chthoniobacteraceae bacterium]